jgi:hypothetical protein
MCPLMTCNKFHETTEIDRHTDSQTRDNAMKLYFDVNILEVSSKFKHVYFASYFSLLQLICF